MLVVVLLFWFMQWKQWKTGRHHNQIMATYYYIPYADILREYLPKPSQYFPYICPWKLDDDVINGLAAEGKFPSMIDLVPALYYFAALSIARLLLQNILFKVYNIYFMI
jgi:hypothetical protein